MLNRDDILRRLNQGEIFAPETWDISGLSLASYDLRIADDFLIDAKGDRYPDGSAVTKLRLEKGEVALVSTRERFRMPWDLVGNMSPKFGFAKKGLLVHTGSIVDPGFGLREVSPGLWQPAVDERVHFFIANVGDDSVELRPGDKIATVQFTRIEPPSEKIEGRSKDKMQRELFNNKGQTLSLAYFAWLKRSKKHADDGDKDVREKLERLEASLADVRAGYQQLTFFAIYVLAAALLTIFGAVVLQGATNSELLIDLSNPYVSGVLLLVLCILLATPFVLMGLLRPSRR